MSNKTTITIDGKNNGAIVAINGVKTELNSLGKEVGGPLGSSLKNITQYLSFGAALGGVTALASLTKQAIDTADELYMMSQKVGVSVESLSTLKYAAELSDLSLDQMQVSLKKLSTNLYDVAHGQGKDAQTAFSELGITAIDFNGKARQTEQVLLDVAERFATMSDGTEKSALAVKLFGRAGLEMIPFLNQGEDGIRALTDEAEKLGLKISTETGKSAEQFNDTLAIFKNTLNGLVTESLPPLLEDLNEFTQGVIDLNNAVRDFSGESLVQGLSRAIGNFSTLGIDLDKITGIDAQIKNFIKSQKELKQHTAEVNKVFYETFGVTNLIYPLMVDNTKKETDELKNQLKTIKSLKDEYAKLIEVQAAGTPQTIAAQASFTPLKVNIEEMFPVEVNPFDPLANYAVDFFDMYDERAMLMRDQTSMMFGNMGSAASMFYQMSGQKAKAWFEVQKAFNIAQALMNTYEGATKALAQGGFFGIAMAATVIAAGLAQVAMIASQRPSSSGSSAGSSGGSTGSFNNNITRNTAPVSLGGSVVNVTINGNYWDEDRIARDMIPALTKAYGDSLGNN